MTRAEYASRKLWDESLMTEEEKEAHLQRVLSFCGKINDDTFFIHDDPIPAIDDPIPAMMEAF